MKLCHAGTLWFHSWNKWELVEEAKIMSPLADYPVGKLTVQTRTCKFCGYKQVDFSEKKV